MTIENNRFEVLFSQKEATILPITHPEHRAYLMIALHEINSKSINPTHELQYFLDTKEIFLINDNSKTQIDIENLLLEPSE